jgi:hypothetical protein
MIDNYAEAMALIEKMKAQLPIPAYPTEAVVRSLRQGGTRITTNQELQINDVLYLGDEGGVACAIYLPGPEKIVTVTSLTHLSIPSDHPLAPEIKAYQAKRAQKLAKMNSPRKPSRFTIKPRKKRKKR